MDKEVSPRVISKKFSRYTLYIVSCLYIINNIFTLVYYFQGYRILKQFYQQSSIQMSWVYRSGWLLILLCILINLSVIFYGPKLLETPRFNIKDTWRAFIIVAVITVIQILIYELAAFPIINKIYELTQVLG